MGTAAMAPGLAADCRLPPASVLPAANAADWLFEWLQDLPAVARPFMRWWWNGNAVAKEEILRKFDLMPAAGVGTNWRSR